MRTDSIASLVPITQIDGTVISLRKSGDDLLLCVKIGPHETSRLVDPSAAERFWMGIKGALPATMAVEDMKKELLHAREEARLAVVAPRGR